jgi:hypothetical protein
VIDLASTYGALNPDGQTIGVLGKKFGKSLFMRGSQTTATRTARTAPGLSTRP